jgi:hypothetical protein
MNTTGLQMFGPKPGPEDQESSNKYDSVTPSELAIDWSSATITTTDQETQLNSAGGSPAFSGSSTHVATVDSVQSAQFLDGAAIVNAIWADTWLVISYIQLLPTGELPPAGVWMGTSSGGGMPGCLRGYTAYKPAKPQA